MANPANTARVAPAGIILTDGHPSFIAFSVLPNAAFWEREVQPPGLDGGPEIDISSMHNTTWVTVVPQALKTLTKFTISALYDPRILSSLNASLINAPGSITIQFKDLTDYDFWGYCQSGIPQPMVKGQPPMIQLTVVPTNYDPNNRVEAGPVLTEVVGS